MKKLLLVNALCILALIYSSLEAPVFKGPTVAQTIQAASDASVSVVKQDPLTNALSIQQTAKDIIKNDLPNITLDTLKNNTAVFKIAWENALKMLESAKEDEKKYAALPANSLSTNTMNKAKSLIITIQDKITEGFLLAVEREIEDAAIALESRKKLLNLYTTLTDDWIANPYGIDAGYASIIDDLVKKLQAAELKSIPQRAMLRGAPMNMTAK